MSFDKPRAEVTKFSEVLEAQISGREGAFEDPYPFMRVACRGLASRLSNRDQIVPMGFVNVTELYLYDLATGVDGFTGEPMPSEVKDMPPVMRNILRLTVIDIAREAFGNEFGDVVDQVYVAMRDEH